LENFVSWNSEKDEMDTMRIQGSISTKQTTDSTTKSTLAFESLMIHQQIENVTTTTRQTKLNKHPDDKE
jgi:hypothetical protein